MGFEELHWLVFTNAGVGSRRNKRASTSTPLCWNFFHGVEFQFCNLGPQVLIGHYSDELSCSIVQCHVSEATRSAWLETTVMPDLVYGLDDKRKMRGRGECACWLVHRSAFIKKNPRRAGVLYSFYLSRSAATCAAALGWYL